MLLNIFTSFVAVYCKFFYCQETSTGVERKAFDKSDNMVIEHAYQSKETSVYLHHDSTFKVDLTEMEVNPRDNPENKLKVMRKEIIEGTDYIYGYLLICCSHYTI